MPSASNFHGDWGRHRDDSRLGLDHLLQGGLLDCIGGRLRLTAWNSFVQLGGSDGRPGALTLTTSAAATPPATPAPAASAALATLGARLRATGCRRRSGRVLACLGGGCVLARRALARSERERDRIIKR